MKAWGARWVVPVACVLGLLPLVACTTSPPTLSAILPNSGYPRQLLAVDGTTFLAKVVWDVGLATETELSNGYLGTAYFQIPAGASPGTHPVAIRNSNDTSSTVNVTVLAPSGSFPPPRIEDVGTFDRNGTGPVNIALMVSAANLDVDAAVQVDGVAVENPIHWSGLPVDFQQSHTPSTFGYPVYHYAQLLNIVEDVALGSTLDVTVTNSDGQSDSATYQIPATLDAFDSDGDGLRDSWEQDGFTAPSGGTIDLPEMGADERVKDVPVEVDWVAAAAPDPSIWATIEQAFSDAPVLNPDGSRGINLILDRGQGGGLDGGGTLLADHTVMDFDATSTAAGYTSFYTYKNDAANFDPDRFTIFHYAIFGRARPNGSSGRGEIWGNDFMVTFVNFGQWGQPIAQVGTFIHEFGHNLGLTHGDLQTTPAQWNETRKPNFPTTMSYRYQFPGVSQDCNFASEQVHTYSEGTFARIDESNVNENIGICDGSPLDFDSDGVFETGAVDTSQDGSAADVHDDFDQWGNLELDFDAPGSGWEAD